MVSEVLNSWDREYKRILTKLLYDGESRPDRTGVGVKSLFGYHFVLEVSVYFPLLSLRRLHFRSIVYELFWFLRGDTNIRYLNDNGVTIWDEWADGNGDLGPIYGYQWNHGKRRVEDKHGLVHYIDYNPLSYVIEEIRNNPTSRRLLISSWNQDSLFDMALPPCHYAFQFYCGSDNGLSILVNMRSCDVFLGLPYNVASYSLLLYMVSRITGRIPRKVHFMLGDYHLYNSHLEAARLVLSRDSFKSCKLSFKDKLYTSLLDFEYSDLCLEGYVSHPNIKVEVAV
jgi:thymidylate synthase